MEEITTIYFVARESRRTPDPTCKNATLYRFYTKVGELSNSQIPVIFKYSDSNDSVYRRDITLSSLNIHPYLKHKNIFHLLNKGICIKPFKVWKDEEATKKYLEKNPHEKNNVIILSASFRHHMQEYQDGIFDGIQTYWGLYKGPDCEQCINIELYVDYPEDIFDYMRDARNRSAYTYRDSMASSVGRFNWMLDQIDVENDNKYVDPSKAYVFWNTSLNISWIHSEKIDARDLIPLFETLNIIKYPLDTLNSPNKAYTDKMDIIEYYLSKPDSYMCFKNIITDVFELSDMVNVLGKSKVLSFDTRKMIEKTCTPEDEKYQSIKWKFVKKLDASNFEIQKFQKTIPETTSLILVLSDKSTFQCKSPYIKQELNSKEKVSLHPAIYLAVMNAYRSYIVLNETTNLFEWIKPFRLIKDMVEDSIGDILESIYITMFNDNLSVEDVGQNPALWKYLTTIPPTKHRLNA